MNKGRSFPTLVLDPVGELSSGIQEREAFRFPPENCGNDTGFIGAVAFLNLLLDLIGDVLSGIQGSLWRCHF
jgi:hypothetical protein